MLSNGKIIAIDGPAGAGKSTIAKEVARKLGYIYIDTGAMYRALTLKALNLEIKLNDEVALTCMAQNTDIALSYDENNNQLIFIDGQDVSKDIRNPLVSQKVSLVAKAPGVRDELVNLQRQLASRGNVVMDGRDIGTNVLPNANFKFYITATVEERARRRYLEMNKQGFTVNLDQLKDDISTRDKADKERATAPLIQAPDAILIDTSNMNIESVVECTLNHIKRGEA